ncbi:unnamed protein product [Ceutorhynchus assimilis]|uniref:C2H2-type domain-containing protein n=1 Tax=Ceutorhynchus assimilis TaxID=467358 RepID=A0A9N9QLY4_9CUCU|nr:unnamed protein product [Ceutorhynchus assimilis]
MDIKNLYPVNYCDIKMKDEPIEETESNDIPKISIKTEYTSEVEDGSDSDTGNLVIKQEFEERSDDYSISNVEIKLEDIPFSNQELGVITHNIEAIAQCDVCSFPITDKSYLSIHKKIRCPRQWECCDMCNYICDSALKMKHHKRKHTGDEDLRLHCKDCSFSTLEQRLLDIHCRENHYSHNTEAIAQCDVCSFTTTDKTYLPIHKKIHRISQCCDMCHYICGSALKLKHHKRKKHMTDEDLRLHCKDCTFSTLVRRHLSIHRKESHKTLKNVRIDDKDRIIKCQYCAYRGKAPNLEKHRALYHEDLPLC